jgi:hypothetical protein
LTSVARPLEETPSPSAWSGVRPEPKLAEFHNVPSAIDGVFNVLPRQLVALEPDVRCEIFGPNPMRHAGKAVSRRAPSDPNRVASTQEHYSRKQPDPPLKVFVDAAPVHVEVDELRLEAGPRAHEHQAE